MVNSKLFTIVHAGERLILETAGGGGYGKSNNRDRQAIRDDVSNGKVSQQCANAEYGLGDVN